MNRATRLRFSPGEIVATRGADALLREQNLHPVQLLARHLAGDWGEVGAEDAQANEAALQTGARLLSVYTVAGVKLFVITEAEPRAATTILLADEY
ncbi:MAG: hypothetical protein J0L76_21165 [Rhodobacterales bacterium]|nr:hypothetical protein [Rhodobacterales bacterium]